MCLAIAVEGQGAALTVALPKVACVATVGVSRSKQAEDFVVSLSFSPSTRIASRPQQSPGPHC